MIDDTASASPSPGTGSVGSRPATLADLHSGLESVRGCPSDGGRLEMIVRRPRTDRREEVSEADLNTVEGLVGDNWKARGCRMTPDGSSHPEMQINVMNARAASLVAGSRDRWGLAGDQLYVDLDLSPANLPPGTRLAVGDAVIEVTPVPHTGCGKFSRRFGTDAVKWVNSTAGRELNLRGINARVVRSGKIRVGDVVSRIRTDD